MRPNVLLLLAAFLQTGVYAAAAGIRRAGGPVVSLDYATFEGASTSGVDKFLGISYAQPPLGDLRFRRPQPPLPSSGTTLVSDLVLLCGPRARIKRGCLTYIIALMVCRPRPLETAARSRILPFPKFRTSTTPRWPYSSQMQIILKIVCVLQKSALYDETHNIAGLYANVFRPTGVTEQSKLPVVVVSPCINRGGPMVFYNWRFAVDLRRSFFHR